MACAATPDYVHAVLLRFCYLLSFQSMLQGVVAVLSRACGLGTDAVVLLFAAGQGAASRHCDGNSHAAGGRQHRWSHVLLRHIK
jgi:hypothetical protein